MRTPQDRAKEIFISAWELPAPDREAFVEGACGADSELADLVRRLLAGGEGADTLGLSAVDAWQHVKLKDPILHLSAALEGRYEILEEAGRGGMSIVYRARDVRHEREVGLKVLTPDVAAAVGPERFLREIRIAAGLQHANIVPLYDSGDADGLLYYVMPFLEGETLQERIEREGPLPVEETLTIAREIGDALDHAHGKGLVHRDVKPGNILFQNGRAVLADFGLATAFSGTEEQRLTQSGVVLGTPSYMSPEQAVGDETDGKSDLYSLGCVVYEMLAGDPPFQGRSVRAVLARHVSDAVPAIGSVRPQLPRGVDSTLSKALAKVPADRFHSARELVEALSSPGAARAPHALGSPRSRWGVAGALVLALLVLWLVVPWDTNATVIPGEIKRVTFSTGPEYSGVVSPDGEYLAYAHNAGGTMDIHVRQLADGHVKRLTQDDGDELLPRWSRDGTRIVYVRGAGVDCDLYTVSPLGGPSVRLTGTHISHVQSFWSAFEALGASPWSLDDERLLFSRQLDTGRTAIFEVELETRETRQISFPGSGTQDLSASWSPDGRQVVFMRLRGGAPMELWELDPASGTEQVLLADEYVNMEPAFLPGGEHVLFKSNRSGMENIWALHLPSRKLSPLTSGSGKDWFPSVSPNGELVYTRWSHQTHLYRVNLASGASEQLTSFTQDNFVGRYAPGGEQIAYQSTRTGNPEVWILDLETRENRNLSRHEETDVLAEWSPDGEEIAFLSSRDGLMKLWVASSDGSGRPECLSDQEIQIPSEVWAVSLSLRWTPDQQSIGYVVADEQGSSLWVLDRHDFGSGESVYPGVLRFDWYLDRERIVYTRMGDGVVELRAAHLRTKQDVLLYAGPHCEMILAPDGGAVALIKSASHFDQGLFLLELEPPTSADGLPGSSGELEHITGGQGRWHVHNGGWSPDGEWIVYTQDTDDGDIYSLTLEER